MLRCCGVVMLTLPFIGIDKSHHLNTTPSHHNNTSPQQHNTEDGDVHEPLAQMMVSVPKRFFKRAVKRNLVKRLVREAYRRNKQVLIDTLQTVEQRKTLSLCFIWTDHNLRSYEEVERKTANLLQRIAEKIGKDTAEEAENVEQ